MSTLREAVLGLDDPVSVYCEWVRLQMAAFYSLFVVHVKLLILGFSYDPTGVRASELSGRSGLRTPGPNATTYPLLLIVVPIIMKGVFFVVIKRESMLYPLSTYYRQAPVIGSFLSSAVWMRFSGCVSNKISLNGDANERISLFVRNQWWSVDLFLRNQWEVH